MKKKVPPTADISTLPRSCSFHFLKLSSSFEIKMKDGFNKNES